MVVGAFRRRTDGEDRHIKLPSGYTATSIANAAAYLEGHVRSIAVGSALVSRCVVGDTRFPTGLAYDEDTLFWVQLMSRASLAVITQPVMIYIVSAERCDDRFTIKPARRFLDWRLALRALTDCGISKSTLKVREGLVALKIARVHYARGDLDTAARFLAVAAAAPKCARKPRAACVTNSSLRRGGEAFHPARPTPGRLTVGDGRPSAACMTGPAPRFQQTVELAGGEELIYGKIP
jgi:hypothetical protein